MNFNDFAIVFVKRSDYEIHFWYASKYYAINIIKHSNLDKKVDYYKFFSLYIKMSETIYYQKKKGKQSKIENNYNIYITKCLKKIKKNLKNLKIIFHRKYLSFFLHCIKWKKNILIFGEDYVIKITFIYMKNQLILIK